MPRDPTALLGPQNMSATHWPVTEAIPHLPDELKKF